MIEPFQGFFGYYWINQEWIFSFSPEWSRIVVVVVIDIVILVAYYSNVGLTTLELSKYVTGMGTINLSGPALSANYLLETLFVAKLKIPRLLLWSHW